MSDTITQQIREELAAVLGCEPGELAGDANFDDLGLDSVFGITFMQRINLRLGVGEPLDLTARVQTIDALAAHLTEVIGDVTAGGVR
ncbi:acyl carrier protein [Nocardia tengchongensis]|uniref:acyl carrier protein n=1 Tax=Nocardia tengchongensis TaxID=2055889 RepID=UPI0033CEBB68